MFTVIIAQQEVLDNIQESRLFLKPLMDSGKIAFCRWLPEYDRLEDMVPTLTQTVGRRQSWRAMVVCDESGLHQANPFDMAYVAPDFGNETFEEAEAWHAHRAQCLHDALMASYDLAAQQPLTRLASFFCDHPGISAKESPLDEDPDYERYLQQFHKKQQLREQIVQGEVMYVPKPAEMVCVARRTCTNDLHAYQVAWESHSEMEYSRFYDRNMFFDKMRYLVFDILPRTQRNYGSDNRRFLYTLLLLAGNEMPAGMLSAQRVYSLHCQTNDEALQKVLQTYDIKLSLTREYLERRIADVASQKPPKLSDREAARIFRTEPPTQVAAAPVEGKQKLFVSPRRIGLANGCPEEESLVWEVGYRDSKKALSKLLKQSRQAVVRAAKDVRFDVDQDVKKVNLLSEHQKDEIRERVHNEELAMLGMDLPDLYDEEVYLQHMARQDRRIQEKCKTRMSRGNTLAVGGLALLAYLLGFFTIFFQNARSTDFNLTTSLLIVAGALGIFVLIALVTLMALRGSLTDLFRDYNRIMERTNSRIDNSLANYSTYFGHLTNVRRGYSVLNAHANLRDYNADTISLYKKHIVDIETTRAELHDIYGHYLVDAAPIDRARVMEYDYNFDRPVSYEYAMPYIEGAVRSMEFLQKGVSVNIPVDFVKSIQVRREELYE